jgi:nicotinamidase-related amidase
MADLEKVIPGWTTGEWTVPEWSFDGPPALLINHMQVGIAGTGANSGAPHAQEKAAMDALGTIDKQRQLIAAFRRRGLPIVFMSVVQDPIGYLPKWGIIFEMGRHVAPSGHLNNPTNVAMAEVIDELGRRPEEPLLYHTGICPMTGSHLEDYLRQFGVRDIVLTGWTAHSTLYNSVVQLTDHWFSVVVPADATGAPERDADCADMVLRKMMRMWCLVSSVDDVIAHLPDNGPLDAVTDDVAHATHT